ncbi:MAG: N-acetyltransferase, partial [Nitrospirota bacterium]
MGEWIIEPATIKDLPDIVHIEQACFSTPWTRKMLAAELSGNPFAHFLLAKGAPSGESGSVSIVGYLCFWVVFEEVRLMNLAVIESMRCKGIARALVMQALEMGLAKAARCAVLEV